MFKAQLHKKLTREQENMEDLLTSNVFGIWCYLPAECGLLQFLRTAERLDGERLQVGGEVKSAQLSFWPWLQEGQAIRAQPDVLIDLNTGAGDRQLMLIESKYLSGKSSVADEGTQPRDQLARELHNLILWARTEQVAEYAVVYVTAHTAFPRSDIEESARELLAKTGEDGAGKLYWTTWRRLPAILRATSQTLDRFQSTMLGDLESILLNMGLGTFENVTWKGWDSPARCWLFTYPEVLFRWSAIPMARYRFGSPTDHFAWSCGTILNEFPWRWRQ